jgi:hypothetical protein
VGTVSAAQTQETMGQNPAFEKGIKLVLDKLRKARARGRLHLGKERRSMFLHETIKGALLRAVTLIMDPHAIMRLEWLLTKSLQALLQKVFLPSRSQYNLTYTCLGSLLKEVLQMSQITLYLDEATQALVEQAAQANGISKSRWVAEIIRKYAAHEWPQECLRLAGQFADFPLRDEAAVSSPPDVERLGF